MPEAGLGGILVIDKPPGMTSHDVVSRTRRLAGSRRVGHAGTLDPAATGVLVLGVEWSTRLLTFLLGHDKSYDATIRFGRTTVTDDAEGETLDVSDTAGLTDGAIAAALPRLTGSIDQVPAAVSAVKVAGQRAYARVRAGEDVQLAPRAVTVSTFEVGPLRSGGMPGGPAWCEVDAHLDVSAGTYIRALARDLGEAVGTGAHLTALRRTRSGPFTLSDATPLAVLESAGDLAGRLLPAGDAAARFLPSIVVAAAEAAQVRHGQRLPGRGTGQGVVAVRDTAGDLIAVADDTGDTLRYLAVTPAAA